MYNYHCIHIPTVFVALRFLILGIIVNLTCTFWLNNWNVLNNNQIYMYLQVFFRTLEIKRSPSTMYKHNLCSFDNHCTKHIMSTWNIDKFTTLKSIMFWLHVYISRNIIKFDLGILLQIFISHFFIIFNILIYKCRCMHVLKKMICKIVWAPKFWNKMSETKWNSFEQGVWMSINKVHFNYYLWGNSQTSFTT